MKLQQLGSNNHSRFKHDTLLKNYLQKRWVFAFWRRFLFDSLPSLKRKEPADFEIILLTIETCFKCFGTCSSDVKENIKTTKPAARIQIYTNFLITPPPWWGEGRVSKMAPVPEGEHFHPTHPHTLFSVNCLNLKQFKTVHYRIQVRTDTTGMVRYLTYTHSINQLLMSCQYIKIILCKGKEKRRLFPPHTAG